MCGLSLNAPIVSRVIQRRYTDHLMAWTTPIVEQYNAMGVIRLEEAMSVVTIGLDLAKTVFQVPGVDERGVAVLRRKLARADMITFFTKHPPCVVGMEACSSAHHWARLLVKIGHTVRLILPQYVKPYVKRNKTDAADAEAICEAVAKPNMRFVPIKTKQQQSILALHRVRSLLVRQRTVTINALRGLLGEYGVIAGKGGHQLATLNERLSTADESVVPEEAREALRCLFRHIDALTEKLGDMEKRIVAWHKSSPDSQRLVSAPGVGPITATAIVAAVGDGKQLESSRHFAAWLGLTPRIKASGGKEKIGRISKGGDRYLRTLLIHGARAVVGTTFRKGVTPRPWIKDLVARRPTNVAATAVAHKTARSLWAMTTRNEEYRHHSAQLMAA